MSDNQCHFYKIGGNRCTMRTSRGKHFCTLHQKALCKFTGEELIKELTSTTRSYLRLSSTHQDACQDPLSSPDTVPVLSNLIYEALNRGYRYKDLKVHINTILNDWQSMKYLRIV